MQSELSGINPSVIEFDGCKCKTKCTGDVCLCLRRTKNPYTTTVGGENMIKGEYLDSTQKNMPIFECNTLCKCDDKCANRLIQNGVNVPLRIVESVNRGLGVVTQRFVVKGEFVCEYAGEVLSNVEAKKRTCDDFDTMNYLITVVERTGEDVSHTTHIDPMYFGNVGRFINHSCDPNLSMIPVRKNNNVPHLALFANKAVEKGQELSFHYNGGEINLKDDSISKDKSRKPCYCRSNNCQKFLPLNEII